MKSENMTIRTLGEILKEARLAKDITIDELSVRTKIHKRIIQTFEHDDYLNFPNRVYVLGFLKSMSEELRFNLKDAVALYEMQSWKNKQRLPPQVKEELPIPEKMVSFHLPLFFKQKRKIKVKWLVAGVLLFVVLVIVSPLLVEMEAPVEKKEAPKVTVEKSKPKVKTKSKSSEKKIAYIQGSQKVSIKAVSGNSKISFTVDKNPLRQLTLKKGSSIILSGEKIRLTVGNYKVLEIRNNNNIVSNFKNIKNKTATVSFPQKVIEKKDDSEIVLSHDVIETQNPRL